MDKSERKKLLKDLAQKKREEFEQSLPMPRVLFEELFDFLDEDGSGCDDTPRVTLRFLEQKGIEAEPVLMWMRERGGYCDCEILANVEDQFQPGAIQ